MYFNGSDTYVRLDSNPFANKSNIYVEAEYLPNNISDSDCIVGSWATDTNMSLLLFTASGGELRCRVKNTSGTVSSDATETRVLQANVKAKVAVR